MDALKSTISSVVNGNSSNETAGKLILLTGASGFIGAQLINSLVNHGYHVKAAVRSNESADKIRKSHAQVLDNISFVIVPDIEAPSAFDDAVKGVDGVIHSASPFVLTVEDNERDLLKPAINGTTGILKSIQSHGPQIKRVVITSSFAAIIDMSAGFRPGHVYTEKDWNPATYEEAAKSDADGSFAYCASKTIAEREAFDYVKKHNPNFTVATICPPMVYGPNAQTITDMGKLNTSSADIYRLINGSEKTVPDTAFWAFVDVRDVAEAHVLAYEKPEAAGQRYFVTSGNYSFVDVVNVIRKDFPEKDSSTPKPEADAASKLPKHYGVDNSRATRELGIKFRSLETTIHDQVSEFLSLEKKLGAS